MKDWWLSLNQREKRIVLAGGIFSFLLLVYLLIWQPFTDTIANMKQDLITQRELLVWIKDKVPEIQNLRQSNKTTKLDIGESLLVTIDNSLNTNNLKNANPELAQTSQNKVRISFASVSFNDMIAWLTQIWQKYPIKIEQVSIIPTQEEGVVKAELTLELQSK